MRNKKRATLILVVFAAVLLAAPLFKTKRNSDEFAQVKSAMRAIRRADNLQYTYANTISGKSGEETSRVDVWSDQLTGRWRAEYYTIDADGAWMFLQRYCSGKEIFENSGSENIWTKNSRDKNMDAPNFAELISLDYDRKDILEETSVAEGSLQKISHVFQIDYMIGIMQQYQDARVVDAGMDYWIDQNGALQKKQFSIALLHPQAADSEALSGEQEEIHICIEVEVTDYNKDGIVQKVDEVTAGTL